MPPGGVGRVGASPPAGLPPESPGLSSSLEWTFPSSERTSPYPSHQGVHHRGSPDWKALEMSVLSGWAFEDLLALKLSWLDWQSVNGPAVACLRLRALPSSLNSSPGPVPCALVCLLCMCVQCVSVFACRLLDPRLQKRKSWGSRCTSFGGTVRPQLCDTQPGPAQTSAYTNSSLNAELGGLVYGSQPERDPQTKRS